MNATSARTNGTLFIVSTPIGNREDISMRALAVLQQVDCILAEDTRHSKQLLTTYGISKPMLSFHAYNESQKSKEIVEALQQGRSYALISDAGTPLISDPGYPLVALARHHGIQVTPIPGASALITALSAAGVPCDTFSFFGFLPAKSHARLEKLKSMFSIEHTLIFYESTHRIDVALNDIASVFGDSQHLVLAKELTKTHEQFISAPIHQIQQWLNNDLAHKKGEFVLIIPPRPRATQNGQMIEPHTLLKELLQEMSVKQAVKLTTKMTGQPKNELYKMAIDLEKQGEQESK